MNLLTISDTHAPFHFAGTLDFLNELKKRIRPEIVIHLGDLADQYCFSAYEKHPDAMNAADELKRARRFVADLGKLFPELRVCYGNHDDRYVKKSLRAGLPQAFIRDIHEVLGCPKTWQWRPAFRVQSTMYMHGLGYSGQRAALKAATDNGMNTVIGHLHCSAGVEYTSSRLRTIWGASAGCLIDPKAYSFYYATEQRSRPVIGTVVVLEKVPSFIPVRL